MIQSLCTLVGLLAGAAASTSVTAPPEGAPIRVDVLAESDDRGRISAVIVEPFGVDALDLICVGLPKKLEATAMRRVPPVGVAPAGGDWRLEPGARGEVCARRDQSTSSRPVVFEVEGRGGLGKLDVAVGDRGEIIWQARGVRPHTLPAAPTITDPAAVLAFPTTVTPGTLALATVTRPDLSTTDGSWTFGGGLRGVVLDPEQAGTVAASSGENEKKGDGKKPEEPEGDEMEDELESEAEFSEVIVVTGTRSGPRKEIAEGKQGRLSGSVLDGDDFEAVSEAIAEPTRLVVWVPESFAFTNKDKSGQGEKKDEKKDGPRTLGDPIPDVDITDEQVGSAPIRVRYTNRYGQVLVDGQIEVAVSPGPSGLGDLGLGDDGRTIEPSSDSPIAGGTRLAFASGQACVCGALERPRFWRSLRFDDEALAISSAGGGVLRFRVPEGAQPGSHRVVAGSGPGAGASSGWPMVVIEVRGSLDREQLFRGGSTNLRLEVVGTQEPLEMKLTNKTPQVITLEGGNQQLVTSSGGEPNAIERRVEALSRGDFDVEWLLDLDSCPCEKVRPESEHR